MTIEQKKLDQVISDIAPRFFKPEVVEQFRDHQKFLISGLDNKEEFRSRLAFADAYKEEFEALHAKLRDAYGLKPGDGEFDYLASDQFRKTTDEDKSYVFDMMKDYMSYKHQKGEISDEARDRALAGEPEPEQAFRKQNLTEKEKDFLIDQSAISEEKKEGLRECRKWMYRNCSKSGLINETGTKRNYIDSFGKRSVAEQINTLYQVEKGHYKYTDRSGTQETAAMSDDYVPTLEGFKDKMVRGWVNPYRHWKKATGDCFYWSRMERALNKTSEMSDHLAAEYEKMKDSKEKGNVAEEDRLSTRSLTGNEEKLSGKIYESFEKAGKKYFSALNDYAKDRSDEKYENLVKQGHEIQQLYKQNMSNSLFQHDPARKAGAQALTALTEHLEKNVRLMDDKSIQSAFIDKVDSSTDLVSTVHSLGSTLFSGVKMITDACEKIESNMETGSTVLGISGSVVSGMVAIKSTVMAGVTQSRKNKAENVKKKNQEQRVSKEDQKELNPNDQKEAKEAEQINAAAKNAKSANKNKRNMHIVAGVGAGISCGLGVAAVATTVGLPITIPAAVVAGIGFGANYAAQYFAGKNPAKKSIDSQMKMEDPDYVEGKDEKGHGKRYIDVKMDERKDMVEEKLGRFRGGTENHKNTEYYIRKPDMLKDRIRVNYAVKNGCMTMYSYRDTKEKENANIAYRHLFLKDPDGPINENNLLKPEEVKQYLSTKGKTGKEKQDAEKRAMYHDLLKSGGHTTSAPENVKEAEQLFTAKDPKDVEKEKKELQSRNPLDEEIKDAEDAQRRMGSAKQDTLRAGKEAGELLKRLEKAGEGKDKEGYRRLKDALTAASRLNGESTPRDVRMAMKELQEAGEAYSNGHKGLFKGIIGSGKERLKIAQETQELGRYNTKVLGEKFKGMDANESIDASRRKQEKYVKDLKDLKDAKTKPKEPQKDPEKVKEEIRKGAQKRAEERQNQLNVGGKEVRLK